MTIISMILAFIGYEIGLKLSLIGQVPFLVLAIVILIRMGWDAGLECVIYLVFFLAFIVGMLFGNLYFYAAFYDGRTHFIDVFSWFFKP